MKRGLGILVLAAVMMLASCSLLPEEATLPSAPVVDTYQADSFKMAYVERGDVILSQKVYCVYIPVRTETLKFDVGGEYYDEVYVKAGDAVKQGDLLAQLNAENILSQIETVSAQLSQLRLQMVHLEENRQLAIERANIAYQAADSATFQKALSDLEEQYDNQRQSLNDQIYIREKQLGELMVERNKRQLRAGFDGTVTYVRKVIEGSVSVAGERFITIADATTSVFRAETGNADRTPIGNEYEILVNKTAYDAVVVDPEALGIQETSRPPVGKEFVYLQLKQPSFELEGGDRGSFTLILDERHDVLMLPIKAITSANGEKIVYYQMDDGVKGYKYIEVGLDDGTMVEICSGLNEGDGVILK